MKEIIFVFGSNTEGRHGLGAALEARMNWGAVYGQARGLQGSSYAIVTKDLKRGIRSVSLQDIEKQIETLYKFVIRNKDKIFIVSALGTNHAGYRVKEIKPLFSQHRWPDNVYFSDKFL